MCSTKYKHNICTEYTRKKTKIVIFSPSMKHSHWEVSPSSAPKNTAILA